MVKCHQCDRNAIYVIGDGNKAKFPVCLRCYIEHQNMLLAQQEMIERNLNFWQDEMAHVVGLPPMGPRFQPRAQPQIFVQGGTILHNIHVSNSEIGVLNTGMIGQVDATVTVIRDQGNNQLADAIAKLSEGIIKSDFLSSDKKGGAIEILESLSAEAVMPKDRRKVAMMRALIDSLNSSLSGVAALADLWKTAKSLFEQAMS